MNRLLKPCAVGLTIVLLGVGGLGLLPAADPPPADSSLIIVDANGKEHKVKSWKFAVGTRPLSWLVPPRDDPKAPKGPAAPEAFEIRDEASQTPPLIVGFVTLIPIDRVRSFDFDEKGVMTVKVTGEKADGDVTVSGSTKFKEFNKFTLEAEVDKGTLGIAEVKFLAGVGDKGVKSIRFPAPKLAEAPAGPTMTVITNDTKKTAHKVNDLQPLYKFADGERLQNVLLFKKTLKVEMSKIHKIRASANMGSTREGPEWGVTLRDSPDEDNFTLITQGTIDGKNAVLEGFVGRTAVGYKLFPPSTIVEIQCEEAK